jgi:anti-sigma-K factor RskA
MSTHPHELLAGYALDALDQPDERELLAHLDRCDDCRTELTELQELTGDLAYAVPPVDPRSQLRGRIMAAIAQEQQPDPEPAPTPGRVHRLAEALRSRPRRTLAGAVALACALVIGGVLVGQTVFGGSNPPGQHAQVLAVGDFAHASIAPDGSLVLLSSDKQPPPGHVYEAWLIRDKQPQPAAILPAGQRARLDTTLTAQPGDTIAITAEPENGPHTTPTGPVLASVVV